MAKDDLRKLAKKKWESSGLSDAVAKKLGFILVPKDQTQKLCSKFMKQACIKLPYFDKRGKQTKFFRIRYLGEAEGFAANAEKERRYAQPDGTLNEVYLPPLLKTSWEQVAADTSTAIIFTEGEFKSAAACSKGLAVIGLGGVEMFRASKKGFPELLATLQEFNWKGRPVAILWDSDVGEKPDALRAQRALAHELARQGANPVKLLALPGGTTKATKVGLDDYLLKHTADDVRDLVEEGEEFTEAFALWSMNEQVCLIQHPPMVVKRQTGELMKPYDFINVNYADWKYKALDDEGKPKIKSVPKEWMQWPLRFKVDRITYRPGKPKVIEDGGRRWWNQWNGWGVESKKGDITPWRQLLDRLFRDADPGAREWFEKWCAYPIQNPGAKMFSAVVIWGVYHGTGKTLAFLTIKDIYGENGIKIGEKQLHGSFNTWAKNRQFVLGEEITGHDNSTRRELANELKDFISSEELDINEKFLPQYVLPNCVNPGFTSNSPNAFMLEDTDRRYMIIEVQGEPLSNEFYQMYEKWRFNGGTSALRYYLESLDVSGFNPKAKAFETTAKREMIVDNKSEIARWCWELKENPDKVLLTMANTKASDKCDLFTTQQLFAVVNPDNDPRRGSINGLSRELKTHGFPKPNRGVVIKTKLGPQRFWIVRNVEKWTKAPRQECAEHWETYWCLGAGKF